MQSVFCETLRFTVTIKPEVEIAIHTFSSGGSQTGEILVFIEAFHEDVTYTPPVGPPGVVPLGMTTLVVKFPEWLANEGYRQIYDDFTAALTQMGMQVEGSMIHEIKTYADLDRPSLIRTAIEKLDSTRDIAKKHLEKPDAE